MIIDDDASVRMMLRRIVEKNGLGRVVAELASGEHAVDEILFYQPDMVLIDYLLPSLDGVEIMNRAKQQNYEGKFIMISQVEDEPMISNAYSSGIVFFIGKPINLIEVLNVIKGVAHSIELERSMSLIKNALHFVGKTETNAAPQPRDLNTKIAGVFSDLGILSDSGSKDLIKLIRKVIESGPSAQYQLQEIYKEMAEEEKVQEASNVNARAIEQRIRRTIQKALTNLASLGQEDAYNSKFTDYGTLLFDFPQVRQEMKYLDCLTKDRGKVSIRKFIEGVISKISG
jgi:two-component system response regulator YcbB